MQLLSSAWILTLRNTRELLKQRKKDEDIIKEKLEEMEGMVEF